MDRAKPHVASHTLPRRQGSNKLSNASHGTDEFAISVAKPVILVASDGEWIGRSLSSVLELHAYHVELVAGGRQTLETVRRTSPDAIFIDEQLSEIGGLSVCQALRDDPLFDHATPVFMVAAGPAAGRARTEAYSAGVWEYCSQPIDVDLLLLKLATFIRARRQLAAERERSLFDRTTGLYSSYGFERMGEVITARAVRNHEALACIVISPELGYDDVGGNSGDTKVPLSVVVNACRDASRRSDLLGYLGKSRLAILAPETDSDGAQQFATRLRRGLSRGQGVQKREIRLRAGFCASADLSISPLPPSEMIRRASTALHHAYAIHEDAHIMSFDQIPLN